MKWVIAVLFLGSASGLLGGLTNVQSWSSSHGVMHYSSPTERLLVLAIGVLCAISAYACAKKKKIGWWLVIAFAIALVGITVWRIARVADRDPVLAFLWFAQIILMVVFLRWWFRQAKLFYA